MSKNGNSKPAMGIGGEEFELSKEVLTVLPSDPYEQLDVARRITAMAVAGRVSKVESETAKLRQKLAEKEQVINGLQERVMEAEMTMQETTARLSLALDEQAKHTSEKNVLAAQVKKLMRDVSKLQTFKQTLMQSLQEDDEIPAVGGGEKQPSEKSNAAMRRASQHVYSCMTENSGQTAKAPTSTTAEPATSQEDEDQPETDGTASKPPRQRSSRSSTPRLTPQLTPSGSPRQSVRASPQHMSASENHRVPLPSSQPTSQSTTAPNSPPNRSSLPTRTPRVDGKEFFRQVRNRLSYEQFSSFLANIKELNAHRQTREETLRKANETFGPANEDLYVAFDGLLSRHLPS